MLLVVTNKSDLACDYLILRLLERRIPFVRLNTEDIGTYYSVDISISGDQKDFAIHFVGGNCVTSNDIDAVYFRQPSAPRPSDDVAPSDRDFVQRETAEELRSLWRLIDRNKWVNHPRNLWLASNKIEQLAVAHSKGFVFPETLVSSTEEAVRAFWARCDGKAVCKAVKHGFTHRDGKATVATTQRIDATYLDDFEEYARVPMIYQREILKIFDIRVTVVGDEIFSTAIHSQDHTETEVDWRIWDVSDFDVRHEPIILPSSTANSCFEMTHQFGLKYSAIDLVLGQDGVFYFLEMNPNGQWAWIEKKTGYPIRDALIKCMGYSDVSIPV